LVLSSRRHHHRRSSFINSYARPETWWLARFGLGSSPDVEVTTEELKKSISEAAPDVSPENKQYLLLKEYHAQGLAQSKVSFWFSLVFAALGFGVIVMGLLTLQSDKEFPKQAASFITMMAGTIIDAVSALFFVQSNKARQLMSEFFDKLRVDRKLEEAMRLAKEIHNPDLRDRLQTLIALNFSEVKTAESLLSSLLGIQLQPNSAIDVVLESAKDKTSTKVRDSA